jgi:hypothetical protein
LEINEIGNNFYSLRGKIEPYNLIKELLEIPVGHTKMSLLVFDRWIFNIVTVFPERSSVSIIRMRLQKVIKCMELMAS